MSLDSVTINRREGAPSQIRELAPIVDQVRRAVEFTGMADRENFAIDAKPATARSNAYTLAQALVTGDERKRGPNIALTQGLIDAYKSMSQAAKNLRAILGSGIQQALSFGGQESKNLANDVLEQNPKLATEIGLELSPV